MATQGRKGGAKTGGGSRKGIPNKIKVDVAEQLAALNCDPIEGMARIAIDPKNSIDLRAKMYAELAQYVSPKRKAVEHSAGQGATVMGMIVLPPKAP